MVAERLIDKVAVSTEAADPALYESIRRTPFDGFLRLLRGLVSLRDEYGSPLDITLAVTCMRENLRDLPNIVSLAAAHGVRRVEMQHLNAVRFAEGEAADKLCVPEQHLREAPREEVLSVLRRVKEEAARGGIRLVLPEGYPELSDVTCPPGLTPPPSPLRCMVPYDWVNVWFNGEVFPCCAIGHQYSLGSVDKLDFFSIWNNLKYRRLLDGLRPGGEPIEPCRRCSLLSV
jgi:radical SAM protein with 4Fe4S-binding SPASM domain